MTNPVNVPKENVILRKWATKLMQYRQLILTSGRIIKFQALKGKILLDSLKSHTYSNKLFVRH